MFYNQHHVKSVQEDPASSYFQLLNVRVKPIAPSIATNNTIAIKINI
ncbi:MAG TPA: hypothetical protein VEY70_15330 [Metabacillus sp.]|nr:hypothetical protein [Metabacillus sp.]